MNYKTKLRGKYITFLVINTILCIAAALFTIAIPFVAKYSLDNMADSSDILFVLLIFFASLLGAFIVKLFINQLIYLFSIRFKVDETSYLYENVFKMNYSKLISKEPTYLVERINIAINTLTGLFANSLSNLIVSILTLAIVIIILLFTSPLIAIFYTAIIPIQFLGYKRLNSNLSQKSQKLQSVASKNFMEILSVTSNVDFIKQSGDLSGIQSILKDKFKNIEYANSSVTKFAKNVSDLLEFSISVLQNSIYIISAYLVFKGILSISDLVFINIINGIFFSALKQLGQININMRDLKGVLAFLDDEIFSNIEPDGDTEIKNINVIDININNLGYEENILIQSGNSTLQSGDIVFVDGKSGSGKSTLLKCLNKLHDNKAVKINSIDVNNINNRSLRDKIFVLSQNILILPATIKENILLGKNISTSEWDKLLNKPFMKKFINDGYGINTIIKENGANLSGGDKQKIALARLYLENPDVIILDESFNSIDAATATDMLQDICANFNKAIIFIVSHDGFVKKYCNKTISIIDKQLI